MQYVVIVCCVALATTFGWSLISKLYSRSAAVAFVSAIRKLPRPVSVWPAGAAAGSLLAEALVAASMLDPYTRVYGLVGALALLTLYTVVLVLAIRAGSEVPCNCFGGGHESVSRLDLLRNGALAVLGAVGLASSQVGGSPPLGDPAVLVMIGVGVGLAVAAIRFRDLAWLFGGTDRPATGTQTPRPRGAR